jgi:hypothetical protein
MPMNQPRQDIVPEFHAVLFDETQDYSFQLGDKQYIRRIEQVYVYDYREETFCCEITPTFYLEPAYSYIVWAKEPNEEKREELTERYCDDVRSEPGYHHVRSIEGFVKRNPKRHIIIDLDEPTMENALENVNANWRL